MKSISDAPVRPPEGAPRRRQSVRVSCRSSQATTTSAMCHVAQVIVTKGMARRASRTRVECEPRSRAREKVLFITREFQRREA